MTPASHSDVDDPLANLFGPPEEPPPIDVERAMAQFKARVLGESFAREPLGPRYALGRSLGSGGSGVVLEAFDRQLDRKVAIKLLDHRSPLGQTTRLQREARALAQLSHPNVVQVHDFGEYTDARGDRQPYLVMEFVAGRTLHDHIRDLPGRWRPTLAAFVPAGRGLLALHRRGLVHRDFKPANVLVAHDGRVRVCDFGLVQPQSRDSDDTPATVSQDEPSTPWRPTLTGLGKIAGTPVYMAPEQHRGEPVTPLSDQYSFALSLWEGLWGTYPFDHDDRESLYRAKMHGPPRVRPRPWTAPGIPGAVVRALRRALQPDPYRRFPDMAALLRVLERELRPRWRRWGPAALATTAGLALLSRGIEHYEQRCVRDARERAASAWDDERRASIRDQLADAGVSSTDGGVITTTAHRYSNAWTTARIQWCHDGGERPEASGAEAEANVDSQAKGACLDRAHRRFASVVDLLQDTASPTALPPAVELLDAMPDPAQCLSSARDARACDVQGSAIDEVWSDHARASLRHALIRSAPNADPTLADTVVAWLDQQAATWREQATAACMNGTVHRTWDRRTLDRSRGCLEERRLELAALADRLHDPDARLELDPLQAELSPIVECVDPKVLVALPDPPEADARDRVTSVRRDLIQVRHLGRLGHYPQAVELARATRQRAEAIGWGPIVAEALRVESGALARYTRYDEGRAAGRRAYALAARHGAWSVAANAAKTMAGIELESARYAAMEPWLDNITVAAAHAGDPLGLHGAIHDKLLASLHQAKGHPESAVAAHRDLLSRVERSLGPDHPQALAIANDLALSYVRGRQVSEALVIFERVMHAHTARLGETHPKVAYAAVNLAAACERTGQSTRAEALLEQALKTLEASVGPEQPDVATVLMSLGAHQREQGQLERAYASYERALQIRRRWLGDEHPEIARSLSNLGAASIHRGHYPEAIALYEQAIETFDRSLPAGHIDRAAPLTGLGNARMRLGRYAEAVPPLEEALALRSVPSAPLELRLETTVILAEALWSAPRSRGRDRPRSRALIVDAQRLLDSIPASERRESLVQLAQQLDRWRADHPTPRRRTAR